MVKIAVYLRKLSQN